MIIDAQKNDKELEEKIQLIKDGVESEFLVKYDGISKIDYVCQLTMSRR